MKLNPTRDLSRFLLIITTIATIIALVLASAASHLPSISKKEDVTWLSIANPAAVYCHALGYTYKIEGEIGYCIFPDGSKCEEWSFYAGKCGQQYSYCAINGYGIETRRDGKDPYSKEYTVCILPDKTRRSVTELMNLPEKIKRCGVRVPEEKKALRERETRLSQLPSYFDWRNYNQRDWMTPIKNQGRCGSCWAFAAIGAVEAVHNIVAKNPDLDLDLSEENLVSDCLIGHSCCGGWHGAALQYIRDNGITTEACFQYVDECCECYISCECQYSGEGICSDATCSDKCPDWSNRLWNISEYGLLPQDSATIKSYLITYGPLVAAMNMDGQFDDNDIYRCDPDEPINHAVVIVGYDDTGGYWIARNSWGPTWHDNGYFKVGYGECSIEQYVYYVSAQPREAQVLRIRNLQLLQLSPNNADFIRVRNIQLPKLRPYNTDVIRKRNLQLFENILGNVDIIRIHNLQLFEVKQNVTYPSKFTLSHFPAPFVFDGKENVTVIVGNSDPHGPCGGAHTLDTVGGMMVAEQLGIHRLEFYGKMFLDTDVAWYNDSEAKVYFWPVNITNIITIGGPGVNMITWRYFANPWYAPAYYQYQDGEWVLITPNNVYRSSEWTGPGKDLALIESIYVPEEDRYVLVASGFGGDGTRAASLILQLHGTNKEIVSLNGTAMIIQWIDSNGNAKVDPNDTWNLIEIVH